MEGCCSEKGGNEWARSRVGSGGRQAWKKSSYHIALVARGWGGGWDPLTATPHSVLAAAVAAAERTRRDATNALRLRDSTWRSSVAGMAAARNWASVVPESVR